MRLFLLLVNILAASSMTARADSAGGSRHEFFKIHEATPPDSGYRLHASMGAGYGSVTGENYQSSPSGEHFLGTLGFGRRTRHWEWDSGLGWGYSRRSGTDQNGNPVSITIRSARTDFSARYRILRGWQVGPIVALTFGTDTHFDLKTGGPAGTFYGGLKTSLDLAHIGTFPVEAWAEALTEISSPGRDAFTSLVGVRISLPVYLDRHVDRIELSKAEPRRDVRVILDANRVFFKTDSARIRPDTSSALDGLATYLKEFPDRWESIEISGHTDRRGTLKYNMNLSKRRATSVETALISHGISPARIQVEACGPTRPLDPANHSSAWTKNRRVELIFKNVSQADPLLEKLAPLKALPIVATKELH